MDSNRFLRLNRFFKELYFINQLWFKMRLRLRDTNGAELSKMADKVEMDLMKLRNYMEDLDREWERRDSELLESNGKIVKKWRV